MHWAESWGEQGPEVGESQGRPLRTRGWGLEGEKGQGPPPPPVLCPGLSCDFRILNVLIVCSWSPLALMSSLSSLIKETIVAWSPWGQQWPGSTHHFLLPRPRGFSPLAEKLRPPAPVCTPHPDHSFSFSLPLSLSHSYIHGVARLL